MRVPQVKERVKESPAQALRAMFAGIGSLFSVTDKIRNKPAEPAAEPETTAPEAAAMPEPAAAPEAEAPAAEAPEPEAPEAEAPETPAPEASALPLPSYDDLSIASLRARLRNLSVDQLAQLIDYEKSHSGRADVIAMFERRIAKVAANG